MPTHPQTSDELLVELLRQVAQLREDVGELKSTARWWGLSAGLFSGLGTAFMTKFFKW